MSSGPNPTSVVEAPGTDAPSTAAEVERRKLNVGLVVTDLRKSFRSPAGERIEVLRGVSFSASRGEAIAITGPSGAGKSTLLHLVGGLEAADHGNVELGPHTIYPIRSHVAAHLRNSQIGFVFQFHHLLSDLTAVENVALPLLIGRKNRHEAILRSLQILSELGLEERADHPVAHLSGGEQQRVAVGRALVNEPLLVLADEPTGNLDRRVGEEISGVLVSYAHRKRAIVVLATHNESLTERCHRVFRLEDGQLHRNDLDYLK